MKKYWILLTAVILFLIGVFTWNLHGNDFHIGACILRYFSYGDYAIGIFAAGKFSIGVFSIGIFSIGIFSIGIFNIGLYAIGLFVIAWRKQLPQLLVSHFKSLNKELTKPLQILVIVFTMAGISLTIKAQDKTNFRINGGFGGPIFNSSIIVTQPTLAIGGGGAMVFNNGLFVGGFGLGTSNLVPVNSKYPNYKLLVSYGGLWLGHLKQLKNNYSISTSLKTGFGTAKLNDESLNANFYDKMVVFTPEISISKRLNFYSSIELGAFYNIFTGINFKDYHNKDFSNFGISLMFKFGGGYF